MSRPLDVLERFCAGTGLTLGEPLSGGLVSDVRLASTAAGSVVVVKATSECVASEAAWLSRHRSAPQVLDVDAAVGVIVLEYVAGRLLVDELPPFDVVRESRWLAKASRASGPVQPGDDDLRARYRRAFDAVRSRRNARPFDVEGACEWFVWVDSLDSSAWRSVAMDVIAKNTIVDSAGDWWAIDPLCATAPVAVGWCPWVVDRTAKASAGRSFAELVADQERLLSASPDPELSAAWMPGALLWTLWWSEPSSLRHPLYLDLFDHWVGRWRTR